MIASLNVLFVLLGFTSISSITADSALLKRNKRFSIRSQKMSFYKMGEFPTFGHHHLLIRSLPPNSFQKMFLVSQHNILRASVPATNMKLMRWDGSLEESAQRHADTCDFNHSTPGSRRDAGENIWAWTLPNYANAVQLWFDEIKNPMCGCSNTYKHCCGHYTQVVWADTNKLGCGFSECHNIQGAHGKRFVLVCHYFPRGNTLIMQRGGSLYPLPAFNWQNSTHGACSECDYSTQACVNGLCY